MKCLANALKQNRDYTLLLDAVKKQALPAALTGLSGIHKAVLLYSLWLHTGKRVFCLCADETEAHRLLEDLTALGMRALFFPVRDLSFHQNETASREYACERLAVLARIENGSCDAVLACADGALQYTMPPTVLEAHAFTVRAGDVLAPETLEEKLLACGFERAEKVEGPGQFARRGGILDVYSPSMPAPVRLEFWGDEVDSAACFDPETQRRTEEAAEGLSVVPAAEALCFDTAALCEKIQKLASSLRGKSAAAARPLLKEQAQLLSDGVRLSCMDKFLPLLYDAPACLLDYCEEDDLLAVSEMVNVRERVFSAQKHWQEDFKAYLEDGTLCRKLDTFTKSWTDALSYFAAPKTLFLDAFARGGSEVPLKTLLNFSVRQLSVWGGSTQVLLDDLKPMLRQKWSCAILAGSERAAKSVAADLREAGIPAEYLEDTDTLPRGAAAVFPTALSAGFEWPGAFLGVLTHGRLQPGKTRRPRRRKAGEAVHSLAELAPGDYVVHESHGIGVYEGIHKLTANGVQKDYLKIRYAKGDTLYVPVTQLDLVSRYIGPREDSAVRLNRLGGADWQKTKTRVRRAVRDMAKDLIKLYAARMRAKGHAFSEDTEMQRDFESRFPYEETEDQLRCTAEIKADMERPVPMDRLLCGDVGFGKTEVALRAAFKCICDSKQCALLVPTTILAWQHYQTILQRMDGFPVTVELLSRFRTPKQQEAILKRLKRGEIDLIVGTHRLVSDDVQFRDLGLVIIDEEQRFGVAQKEKLKTLRENVDVLTLSATPIPRTLNMAMSGIRDMSVLEEAPQDRHPVQTYVLEHDEGVLADAVRRELRRGGQVYWLHNDIGSIEGVAARLQARVPEARIGIGHGKMGEQALSEIWRQLIDHEIDVLVCTTIIETGVDVPNANTLIIDNADRLGLSQLHQIRGRVGRSSRRAYAYFTFTPNKVLSEIAQKRLSAIREFTEFGSGFQIAMRDLEIRGAGSLLGGEQHGHMEAVGYDLYLKLLGDAVAQEKGEERPQQTECLLDLQIEAHIPERYIATNDGRLEMYRRIADIRSEEDALDVTDELIDRYGDPPKSVEGLIQVALLRNTAGKRGIAEVKQQGGQLLLYPETLDMHWLQALTETFPGRVVVHTSGRQALSLKLQPGEAVLEVLKKVLEAG